MFKLRFNMDLTIELRTIRIMLAIEQEGSFAKASEVLYISQPALTQYIKRIEDQLSYPLYKREKGRCVPTEAAKILLSDGKVLLEEYKNMVGKMELATKTKVTEVSFGWPSGYTLQYLNRIKSDEALFETLHIDIHEESVENLIEKLLEKKLNFLLVPALYSHPDLVYQTIRREEFYLAVPATHVANKLIKENNDSNFVDLSRLNGMPFISLYAKAYKEFMAPLFIEAGYKPNIIFVCNNWNNSHSLVEMGLGLAIVPYWFAESKHEKINYYRIKTKFRNYRLFSCVYNRKKPLTPEVQEFVDHVKKNYGDEHSNEPFEYSILNNSFSIRS